jgi:hypothetical protein
MKAFTDELKEILYNLRDAFDNMQITYTEYVEAKAALLEDAALQAELITEG